jgi:hypothetical protein
MSTSYRCWRSWTRLVIGLVRHKAVTSRQCCAAFASIRATRALSLPTISPVDGLSDIVSLKFWLPLARGLQAQLRDRATGFRLIATRGEHLPPGNKLAWDLRATTIGEDDSEFVNKYERRRATSLPVCLQPGPLHEDPLKFRSEMVLKSLLLIFPITVHITSFHPRIEQLLNVPPYSLLAKNKI